MIAFPWARRPAPSRVLSLPPDRPLFVVSDIHLGDGSPSDAFVGKDEIFLKFLEHVRERRAHLVIGGDIIDFPQALTFTRVLRAHGPLLRALSELADDVGITYLWGNHDYDIALYRDLLRWNVGSSVEMGEDILLVHGHQFDPYVANNLRESAMATLLHHLVERVMGSWIRVPLDRFYTRTNRLAFWVFFRSLQVIRPLHLLLSRLGVDEPGAAFEERVDFWVRSQLGDSMYLFPFARTCLERGRRRVLVCGHSHTPGRVEVTPGRWLVNTGSWTFEESQYAEWDGTQFTVRDWMRQRVVEGELYAPMLDGSIDGVNWEAWWAEEYLGWFRFRCGEWRRMGRALPSWAGVRRRRVPSPMEAPPCP